VGPRGEKRLLSGLELGVGVGIATSRWGRRGERAVAVAVQAIEFVVRSMSLRSERELASGEGSR
jgi:hypothetical protein